MSRLRTVKDMQQGWAKRGLASSGGGASMKSSPVDHASGEMDGNRSRTNFAGMTERAAKNRVAGERGSMPVDGLAPKPPPVMVLYEDLAEVAQLDFDLTGIKRKARGVPVYGQYPRALIPAMLPWLGCARHEILHVCSGALPPGEGIRVDIRPAAKPDYVADGRRLPFADGSHAAVMLDPPYTEHYARELYGVKYPRPSQLLREATRVVRPGGRILIVHYITPKPVAGMTFVKAWGLSTGFDMPMRAVTVYERDGGTPQLFADEPVPAREAR